MPTMKKFPEFELTQQLIRLFSDQIGPTRMNKTTSETRARMVGLATETTVKLEQILNQEPPPQIQHSPDDGSGD